ncbi:hypothetical protein V2J09_013440 [Rumex salicifolius]
MPSVTLTLISSPSLPQPPSLTFRRLALSSLAGVADLALSFHRRNSAGAAAPSAPPVPPLDSCKEMASSDIRGLLSCFSPSLDFFAICAGDGRIKVWDTLKGQLQTEFSDLVGDDEANVLLKSERGHLSIDYTCMKWLSLERKKKRKLGASVLVLGTGSGDVLALDVSAGHLRWKISDCHPGGVSAVSSSNQGSSIFTSGADGMVCEIDPSSGNLINKFKASTKAVSSLSVSPDGKAISTAAAQLKILNCSDHKKIQKFSGHPGAVQSMIWTEDGKFVFSCAAGERYVAVWRVDGGKKQSASCVLAMEHPAVYLDCKCEGKGENGKAFYVLAISEMGICYFWYGRNFEELHKSKPTRISVSLDGYNLKESKGTLPAIFSAKLQNSASPASAHVFFVHGLQIKPSFEKFVVNHGEDLKLNSSTEGVLLPSSRSQKFKKQLNLQSGATALDRANAEDALLPIPKVFDLHDRKKQDLASKSISDHDESMQDKDNFDADKATCCIEDQLRTMGILGSQNNLKQKLKLSPSFLGIDIEASVPEKKMRAAVLSIQPNEACKLFTTLMSLWQSRSCNAKYVLPWICCLLVNHSQAITEEYGNSLLEYLYKISKSKGAAVQSLFQLYGRLQLVTSQIDKASQFDTPMIEDHEELESEDDDVDEEGHSIPHHIHDDYEYVQEARDYIQVAVRECLGFPVVVVGLLGFLVVAAAVRAVVVLVVVVADLEAICCHPVVGVFLFLVVFDQLVVLVAVLAPRNGNRLWRFF